ncbi:MAG: hypothetical protein U0491_00345 [Candidatus Saccharimonadales bacterium]
MRFRTAALAASAVTIIVSMFGFVPSASATESSPNPTQSEDCVRVVDKSTVKGSLSQRDLDVTFTASIPKPACEPLAVAFGDIYTLPETYDGSGKWNGSASGQPFNEWGRTTIIIPAGKTTGSVTKSVVGCGWFQADVYTGPQLDYVVYPQGHGKSGYKAGKIFFVECHSPSPEPSDTPSESPTDTPTPTPTDTPSVTPSATPTPSQTVPATQPPSSPPATSSVVPPTSTSKPPTELAKTGGDNTASAGITGGLAALFLAVGTALVLATRRKPSGSHR